MVCTEDMEARMTGMQIREINGWIAAQQPIISDRSSGKFANCKVIRPKMWNTALGTAY